MSNIDFNFKYKDYLIEGYYGLGFDIPEFTEWLDIKFQEFIKNPDFKYKQLKQKFGYGRFYCEGLSHEQILEVENKITNIK